WTRPYSSSADRLYKRILPLRMSCAPLAQAIVGQDDDFTAAGARFAPGGAVAGAAIRLHRRDHAAGLLCGGGFAAQGAAARRLGGCRQRHRRRRRPRASFRAAVGGAGGWGGPRAQSLIPPAATATD